MANKLQSSSLLGMSDSKATCVAIKEANITSPVVRRVSY